MTNVSPTQNLGKIGSNSTARPWFSCTDYHQITGPGGVGSAYPYGPNNFSWSLNSPSKLLTATELNSARWPTGKIQISFVNAATKPLSASANFACSSLYPGYGVTGIRVLSIDGISSTAATITWSLDVTTLGRTNILGTSTWHLEYGTTAGDYSTVSVSQPYVAMGPNGTDNRSITLTGLTPGTTYHFRVVLDVNSYSDHGNRQTSYGDPSNSFTTSTN